MPHPGFPAPTVPLAGASAAQAVAASTPQTRPNQNLADLFISKPTQHRLIPAAAQLAQASMRAAPAPHGGSPHLIFPYQPIELRRSAGRWCHPEDTPPIFQDNALGHRLPVRLRPKRR